MSFVNKIEKKLPAKIFIIIVTVVYFITFIGVSANIRDPYLWFDEAGQFWISKGLNHYSNPLQVPKGLSDVIINNAAYNMDPGGFSILLHFWTEISNSYLWLRLLPFLFFIGTIGTIIYLSYRWTRNINIALLLGFLPFLFSSIVSMGFEIRAYSMEYLGVILTIVALESLKAKISSARLFIWSCIFSIFVTSRYSIIIVVFIASVYVVFLVWKSNKLFWGKAFALFLYSLPLFASLAYIYFFAFRIQNPKIDKLIYLSYLIDDWRLLYKPISNFLYLLFVIFLVFAFVISLKRKSIFYKYQALLFVTVASNLSFILLSFLGKYPWEPLTNYGLPYFIITLLCFSSLLGEILVYFLTTPSSYKYISVLVVVLLSLYIRKDGMVRKNPDSYLSCIGNIDYKNINAIYIDRWANPEVRFLFEYGVLKPLEIGNYPKKFTFQKIPAHNLLLDISPDEWTRLQPKMNNLIEYDLLIIPQLESSGELNNNWTLFDGCKNGVFIKK